MAQTHKILTRFAKVRHASTLSTRNPAIFHAADAMERFVISPSSMGCDNAPLPYL
jgi:hypothetical protein